VRIGEDPNVTVVDLRSGATVGECFGQLPQLLVD
jgi:hypothetical protein